MKQVSDGAEFGVFAGPDGEPWWTDRYVMAPVPQLLVNDVHAGGAYVAMVSGLRPAVVLDGQTIADAAPRLLAAGVPEDVAPLTIVGPGVRCDDKANGAGVVVLRRHDGRAYVADRYASLLDGDVELSQLRKQASKSRIDPADTMLVVRRPDGRLAAVVMPLRNAEIRLVEPAPVTPAPGTSTVTPNPRTERPMGQPYEVTSVALDVTGAEVRAGDKIVVDGKPRLVVGVHRHVSTGRLELLLNDGLSVTADRYRLAGDVNVAAPVGVCVPCGTGHHDRCDGPGSIGGCRCHTLDHPAEPTNTNKEHTMSKSTTTTTITPEALDGMSRPILEGVCKGLGVPYSGRKMAELVTACKAKIADQATVKKAAQNATGKAIIDALNGNTKPLESIVEKVAPKAAKTSKPAPAKSDTKPKADTKPAPATACELCGNVFSKPRRNPRCNSEAACKARQEGKGRAPRGTKADRPAGTNQGKATAAKAKVDRARLAAAEHKAFKAWEAAGRKGTRPSTENLDAVNAEHDAKSSTEAKAS